MAQKYNWLGLKTKLLNLTYCPIDQLITLDGFDRLGTDIPFKLALKRVPFAVEEKGAQNVFKIFNKMHEPHVTEVRETIENQKGSYDVFAVRTGRLDGMNNQDKSSAFDDNRDEMAADIEIKDQNGAEIKMMVHSQIVGFYSKVRINKTKHK